MFKFIRRWFDSRRTAQQEASSITTDVEIIRLTPEVYAQLVKQLPGPLCPKTDLEAGFLLGVQTVLQKLRDGYVMVR
jgi:hypothetical protein